MLYGVSGSSWSRVVVGLRVVALAAAVGCAGASKVEDQDAGTDAEVVEVDAATSTDAAQTLVDLAHAPGDLAHAGDMAMQTGGSCNPANETLGAGGGPDTCAYGQICSTPADHCDPAPTAACQNASGAPAWNTAAKMAPVIIKATATSLATTNATTECAGGDPAALVTVDFYAPEFLTTTDDATAFLSQLKFKKSTMASGMWFNSNFIRMLPPKNAKFGSFQVGINCGNPSSTAGIYIVDAGGRTSNPVCVTW